MPGRLTLLDGVRWDGRTIPGDRAQALLAALVDAGRTVHTDRLVDLVWDENVPANPAKALQVLVSRVRSTIGADTLLTDGDGYRLQIAPTLVDALHLGRCAQLARAALAEDPAAALRHAEEALALAPDGVAETDRGPLADVRRRARIDLHAAAMVRARALERSGRHAEALPALEA
ncbi:AfsR/SARP family transcriptional regulator, partial [Nocardioides sp. GCM10030258]|uniref:AfsR/SARP family transcriptional regulator n=1 Tax=Nocardioides sp. CPCC 206348 TaxID=3406464 RepID=UPI0036202D1D